jgi:hypothetical protein
MALAEYAAQGQSWAIDELEGYNVPVKLVPLLEPWWLAYMAFDLWLDWNYPMTKTWPKSDMRRLNT